MGTRPDTFYARLPLRRIAERFVTYDPADLERVMSKGGYTGVFGLMVERWVRLDCGHVERDDGRKAKMRCTRCGIAAGLYPGYVVDESGQVRKS